MLSDLKKYDSINNQTFTMYEENLIKEMTVLIQEDLIDNYNWLAENIYYGENL